jgi:large subunit ribosomal protein L18
MRQMKHDTTPAERRKRRVRAVLHGTTERPRVTVFRSNAHTHLQAIDDVKAHTLVAAGEHEITEKGGKMARGVAVAKVLAKKMKEKKIQAAVFDRGSYKYHGRVKAIADALREEGIQV